MEPICIAGVCMELGLDVGGLILAAVAGLATWLHHLHHGEHVEQRERHHQQMAALHERRAERGGAP